MINIEDNGMFEIFPAISTISEAFEYQNSMLNKIVLTGKINALEIAENLFDFTEQTAQTFTELQSQIISSLINEYHNELFLKAKTKAKIAIDTLSNNLNIRKNAIKILSKDNRIKEFLNGEITKQEVRQFLEDFLDKYSVYNEVLIVDKGGKIRVSTNLENKVSFTRDNVFDKVGEEVVTKFGKTDMFIKERSPFFYVVKIEDNDSYLVVSFKFKEETDTIFQKLITDNECIAILDKKNNILAASEKGLDKSFFKSLKKCNEAVISNSMFFVKVQGIDEELYAVTTYKKRNDINVVSEFYNDTKQDNNHLAQLNSNNKELQKLADDGYAILEDLSDVIINGELIAAKSKQYILIPILDNLREVSMRIVKLIELSISNLQNIIEESFLNDLTIVSKFIADALIRNLYERCNDVKFWAMLLSNQKEDEDISVKLKFLNDLYPNYTDIFVYDNSAKIKYISNSTNFISDQIENNYTASNKDQNRCFVSEYGKTKFSNNDTFIYYSTILKDSKVVGGIGAVFDIQNNLQKIFDEIFSDKGIVVIVNKNKKIIYSNSPLFKETFDLVELQDNYVDDIRFKDVDYKVSISQTSKYREYENDSLFAVVLMER